MAVLGIDTTIYKDIQDSIVVSEDVFSGLTIPSTPQSEYWVFGVVLALFLFAIIALNRSTGWIMYTLKGLARPRKKDSSVFKSTIREYQSRLLLTICSTGVIVMLVYTEFFLFPPFSILNYLYLVAIVFAFLILRNLLAYLIGYVFILKESVRLAREQYYGVYSFLGLILFPIMLIRIYATSGIIHDIAGFIAVFVGIVAYIVIVALLFQIFFKKILDLFYIMLYLCTLEILPLIGMIQAFKIIIEGV